MLTRSLLTLFLVGVVSVTVQADKVILVAGGGDGADASPAVEAKVVQPFACEFDAEGGLWFVEMAKGERLRYIAPDGTLVTKAGTGIKGYAGDGGTGLKAMFNGMHNLLIHKDGMVYLADSFNNRIRTFDPKTDTVSLFAGDGQPRFMGDGGPAREASFHQIICIAWSADQSKLYIADINNRRVRAIDMKTKIVTTVAGNGKKGIPKNGAQATEQPLVDPRAVTADNQGNLYILERGGHALRVVRPDGTIHTVAGTGKAGKGGDGGPALQAAMNGPKFLAMDRDGSVLIVDTENHQIRRYVPGKEIMELVAGTGKRGAGGVGGDPKQLEMARPHGVTVHPRTGEIYIADSDNGRIIKIVKD